MRAQKPRIIDIGCGSGVPTLELAKLSKGELVGLNIDVQIPPTHFSTDLPHFLMSFALPVNLEAVYFGDVSESSLSAVFVQHYIPNKTSSENLT